MKSLRKEGSYSVERRGSHLAGLEGQAFTIRITWAKFRWLEGEGSSKFGGEGGGPRVIESWAVPDHHISGGQI